MSSILDQKICLKLNAVWQVIGYCTVKEAIVAMNGMPDGTPPALALDELTPTKWDDWIRLPVRIDDRAVLIKNGAIRAPLVIIDSNFSKMPVKAPKLTNKAILERDGYIDQYTGERLRPHEATVDHFISKDVWKRRGLKGNPNNWRNMLCCKKERNHKKGNRTAASQGLTPIRKPQEPKAIPVSHLHKPKLKVHEPFFSA